MKIAAALFPLAFGALSMAAWGIGPVPVMAFGGVGVSAGCPMTMHLDQSTVRTATNVKNRQNGSRFQTGLRLILSSAPQANVPPSEIKAASVITYGLDTTPRAELTWSMQSGSRGPAKSMTVHFVAQSDGSSEADFTVAGLPAASLLEIHSITFANGSTWKPAPGRSCAVAPDPFVLISKR